MKKTKGFTLVELLAVIVIIGIMVTVALPKYKVALEKGRAAEGAANAYAVSEAVNAFYIQNYNSYGTATQLCTFAFGCAECTAGSENCIEGVRGNAAITNSKFFTPPSISLANGVVTVSVSRRLPQGKDYTIVFTSQDGVVTNRSCIGNQAYCNMISLSGPVTTGSI